MKAFIKWLTALLLLIPCKMPAQQRSWEAAVAGGIVYNAGTPLEINQQGHEKLRWQATYRTEPLKLPVYYDLRLRTRKADRGWEIKFTHHKLILDKRPPEIQRFSITNGFNLLTLNRLWEVRRLYLSAGLGMVITHPESTIRQKPFPENKGLFNRGYYISGPTLELALIKPYYLTPRWFVFGEGRATASYVEVPVSGGHAHVTNAALHFLLGTGYGISPQSKER